MEMRIPPCHPLGPERPSLLPYCRDSQPHRARSLGGCARLLGALPHARCLELARRVERLRLLPKRARVQSLSAADRSASSDRVRASAAVKASGVVGRPFA